MGEFVIVGATGAVGREALDILESRGVPASEIRAVSRRPTPLPYAEETLTTVPLDDRTFDGARVVLFCADASTARAHAPRAVEAGAVVVDNSSAFRMTHPLVIPQVNGDLVEGPGLYANPNCSTIMFVTALDPVRRGFGLRHVTVATYQAVSGAGREAIEELRTQIRDAARGDLLRPGVFPEPCLGNVFPHESELDDEGFNGEERKMIAESARLWNEDLPILPTCVRVPVERAHSQAIVANLETPATTDAILEALRDAPGVRLVEVPTPLKAAGTDEVHVGRVRVTGHRVALWICCDQLRRGAALNAIEIADLAIRKETVPTA